jgi:hypothetical protein
MKIEVRNFPTGGYDIAGYDPGVVPIRRFLRTLSDVLDWLTKHEISTVEWYLGTDAENFVFARRQAKQLIAKSDLVSSLYTSALDSLIVSDQRLTESEAQSVNALLAGYGYRVRVQQTEDPRILRIVPSDV